MPKFLNFYEKILKRIEKLHEFAISANFFLHEIYFIYTRAHILMHIAAMAYYINVLDSQSSGRGRGGPNYFKVEDLFLKNT